MQYQGETALYVPRWIIFARLGRLILLVLVLGCLAGVVAAARNDAWGYVALAMVAGLIVAGALVRDWRKMPYDGGLWLTPTRVVHQWRGDRRSVAWEDIVDQDLDPPTGDVQLAVRGGDPVVVSGHLLAISGRTVLMFLDMFGRDQGRRSTLGTEATRVECEEVRETMDTATFQPPVHGAPKVTTGRMFTASVMLAVLLLVLALWGRTLTIDDDDLADQLARQLSEQGRPLQDVSCEDDLDKEVGATVRCLGTENGQERTLLVEVTSVDDDAVRYDISVR